MWGNKKEVKREQLYRTRTKELKEGPLINVEVGATVVEYTLVDGKVWLHRLYGSANQYTNAGNDETASMYNVYMEPHAGSILSTTSLKIAQDLVKMLEKTQATLVDDLLTPTASIIGTPVAMRIVKSDLYQIPLQTYIVVDKESVC